MLCQNIYRRHELIIMVHRGRLLGSKMGGRLGKLVLENEAGEMKNCVIFYD